MACLNMLHKKQREALIGKIRASLKKKDENIMVTTYEPEISTVLTLSTMHISEKTAHLLDAEPDTNYMGLCVYPKCQYGWYIAIDQFEHAATENIPNDLLKIISFAKFVNCSLLCLDCDAGECPFLPVYEW